MKRLANSALLAGVALSTSATSALAVFTTVTSQDTIHCDPLMTLSFVDELGNVPPFPANEAVASFAQQVVAAACPSHDNPNIPNVLMRLTNLTTLSFTDLHYVADPPSPISPGTNISNEDGLVNGGQAFRIDKVGINTPLLGESINNNGIFEPGEFWEFLIDDYINPAGVPADALNSIGVGFASPGGPSSGSIVALPIPEPSSFAALCLGGLSFARRRSRRALS
jgi:hypothetical protein